MPHAKATELDRIKRFVVLMLENRSFDHMLGYMGRSNPAIAGVGPGAYNYRDPVQETGRIEVAPASTTAVQFDPPHEFEHVREQIHGPAGCKAKMSGFVSSAHGVPGVVPEQIMQCFEPQQIPVFSTLADEFAIFNFWYSSMPGPTWANRFFLHAGTSGGLTRSEHANERLGGFTFPNGTLFDRLGRGNWRVYFDDWPQIVGIKGMPARYVTAQGFSLFKVFEDDVRAGDLPKYTFIEPFHDPLYDFRNGNSMHPCNDVRRGEELIKKVYEAIRGSPKVWKDTMLIVTFDEHGGFYDHIEPPRALATGDDRRYATAEHDFRFDRYGVRVPTIVASAYTERRTVIGDKAYPDDSSKIFDHTSIVRTVCERFSLRHLCERDRQANSLVAAVNRTEAREDLGTLPDVLPPFGPMVVGELAPTAGDAPLTSDQRAYLSLVRAVDAELHPQSGSVVTTETIQTLQEAREYAARVHREAMQRHMAASKARPKPKP